MFSIPQLILAFLPSYTSLQNPDVKPHDPKSVAIVGAGSAGLAMLKTILDLPEETRIGWNI